MLLHDVIVRGLRTAIATRSFGKILAAGLGITMALQLFIVVGGGPNYPAGPW